MKFIKRAFSLFRNSDSEGSGFVSKIAGIIGKISVIPVLMVIVPIVMIFIIFISFMGMFSYKLNLLQLVDPHNYGDSSENSRENYDFGILNYSENDFKECIAISGGATYTSNYSDFASRASSSTDSNFNDITSFNSYIKRFNHMHFTF